MQGLRAHLAVALLCLLSTLVSCNKHGSRSVTFKPSAVLHVTRADKQVGFVEKGSFLNLAAIEPPATDLPVYSALPDDMMELEEQLEPEGLSPKRFVTDTDINNIIEVDNPKGNTNSNTSQANSTSDTQVLYLPDLESYIKHTSQKVQRHDPTAKVLYTVRGLDAVAQHLASNGTNGQVEPPDQAMCVGSGFLLEAVNLAVRIRDSHTGKPLTDAISLNQFFRYAPDRIKLTPNSNYTYGQFLSDPTCIYDSDTKRFFLVVLTIKRNASTPREFLDRTSIDVAVSKSHDPRGEWWYYRIPTQNDGSQGTPNHHLPNRTALGDYPHIGSDSNGLYITTNEFALKADNYTGVNLYAINKYAMAEGSDMIKVVNFFLNGTHYPFPFTVQPTKLPASGNKESNSAYFVSTSQVEFNGTDLLIQYNITSVGLWKLSSTCNLLRPHKEHEMHLTVWTLPLGTFGNMLYDAEQKNGSIPYGKSLNSTNTLGFVATNDIRIINAFYAAGKLWATFHTQTYISQNVTSAAVVFTIDPAAVTAHVVGILAIPGQHLLFPSVAINSAGRGAVGFTLVGPKYYPTAAYAIIHENSLGPVTIAAPGKAPQDGKTEYSKDGSKPRPRWGDYGAGAVDEQGNIYLANEYIADAACPFKEFNSTNTTVRCGGTRTNQTNWDTAITKLFLQLPPA